MYEYYLHDFTNGAALRDNEIFVFGSNLAGRHGRGAAKTAMHYFGAEYGWGLGLTGKCYALPTKDRNIVTLPIEAVTMHVEAFKVVARIRNEKVFIVTKIGCGLAGYKDHEIAPLFKGAPSNCKFHTDWKIYLEGEI